MIFENLHIEASNITPCTESKYIKPTVGANKGKNELGIVSGYVELISPAIVALILHR